MSSRKSLLALSAALLILSYAQTGDAGHGTSSSGSSKLFGSVFECAFGVGDTKVQYDSILAQLTQKSEPGKTVSCRLFTDPNDPEGTVVGEGEFLVDLTAAPVRTQCDGQGTLALTVTCGDSLSSGSGKNKVTIKADIKGTFTASDPANNPLCNGRDPCVINIGGADQLKPKGSSLSSCIGLFGENTTLLITTQFFPDSPNCTGGHIDDGGMLQQMCHAGFSFDPAVESACVVTVDGQKVTRKGEGDQDLVKIVAIDVDPNTINIGTCTNHILTVDIFGETNFKVRQIDFDSVRLGDGIDPDEPVAKNPDGSFRVSFGDNNLDGVEDARAQFNRCNSIIDQLRGGNTTLVLTGSTLQPGAAPFQGQDTVNTSP